MQLKNRSRQLLATAILATIISTLTSCSLFFPTINIELPKGYVGWCFVIPVYDTVGMNLEKNASRYLANNNGVVYVPASRLDLRKDNVVRAYDNGEDVSDEMRYAANVSSTKRGVTYEYLHFYMPSVKERRIPELEQYWHDQRYKYDQLKNKLFDSLVARNEIIFR